MQAPPGGRERGWLAGVSGALRRIDGRDEIGYVRTLRAANLVEPFVTESGVDGGGGRRVDLEGDFAALLLTPGGNGRARQGACCARGPHLATANT